MKTALGVCLSVVPGLIVAAIYASLLGYRRDYLGHYAAGFGGTLGAVIAVLAALPSSAYGRLSGLVPLCCTVMCVCAGAVAEATVFRLAKFDEVDFCNQSLGAVLAGMATLHLTERSKPSDRELFVYLSIGLGFLVTGTYYALS